MFRRAFVFGGLSAGVALAAGSCADPTQVTIAVRTSAKCESFSGAAIIAGPNPDVVKQRSNDGFLSATATTCKGGEVGTLVLTPGGSAGSVLVAGGVQMLGAPAPSPETCAKSEGAPGCIVAKRSFAFVDHTNLTLPIELDPVCAGISCAPSDTCYKGACVSAEVTCEGSTCRLPQEPPVGTGSGTDASSGDGAYDAEIVGDGSYDDVYDAGDAGLDGPNQLDATGDGGLGSCHSYYLNGGSWWAVCQLMAVPFMSTPCACTCNGPTTGTVTCSVDAGNFCEGPCQ